MKAHYFGRNGPTTINMAGEDQNLCQKKTSSQEI